MRLDMSELIALWTKERKVTLRRLAEQTGINYSGLFRLVKRERQGCSIETLFTLAENTGHSVVLMPKEYVGMLNDNIIVLKPMESEAEEPTRDET